MNFAVATDGSEQGEAAVEHAVRLAGATGGSVTIVHALAPSVSTEGGEDPITDVPDAAERLVVEDPGDATERGEHILENARRIAEDAGVDVRTELLEGEPVDAIRAFAESEGVDGIVVGHRGLSERYEDYLGSVAKSLVEHSPVPVTVVT